MMLKRIAAKVRLAGIDAPLDRVEPKSLRKPTFSKLVSANQKCAIKRSFLAAQAAALELAAKLNKAETHM